MAFPLELDIRRIPLAIQSRQTSACLLPQIPKYHVLFSENEDVGVNNWILLRMQFIFVSLVRIAKHAVAIVHMV